MTLPAAVLMTMGAIGMGVLAFAIMVGFSRPQAIPNAPHRDRREAPSRDNSPWRGSHSDNSPTSNDGVRRRPIVCNDCSICQDEIERFQDAMQIRCGHRFHSDCLKEWLKNSQTCPSCRCMAISM